MQTVWVSLAALLMLTWLMLAAWRPRREEAADAVVLSYGPVVRTAALILALAPTWITVYVVWTFPWNSEAKLNFAGISFIGFCLAAGLFHIDATRHQVILTERELTRHSPWSAAVSLPWSDVERVRYSVLNRWFIIEGAGRIVRVSRHLGGIRAFVAAVRRHVPPERCLSAKPVLDALEHA